MASLDWLKNRSRPTEAECYELGPEHPLPAVTAPSATVLSTVSGGARDDVEFVLGKNDPKLAFKVFSEYISKGTFGVIDGIASGSSQHVGQGSVFLPFETPQEKLLKVQKIVKSLENEVKTNATAASTDMSAAISSLNTQLSLISAQIKEAALTGPTPSSPAFEAPTASIPTPAPLPSASTSALAFIEQRLRRLEVAIGTLSPSSPSSSLPDLSSALLSALRLLSLLQAGNGGNIDAAIVKLRLLETTMAEFSKGSAEEMSKLTEAWERLSATEAAAEAVQDTVTRLVSLRDAHNKVISLSALEDENRSKQRLLEDTQARMKARIESLREAITENSEAISENTRILESRMNQILEKLNK